LLIVIVNNGKPFSVGLPYIWGFCAGFCADGSTIILFVRPIRGIKRSSGFGWVVFPLFQGTIISARSSHTFKNQKISTNYV